MISKKVNGIPKTEIVYVTGENLKGETYYITSKEFDKSKWYLYKWNKKENKAEKISTASDPTKFENIMKIAVPEKKRKDVIEDE